MHFGMACSAERDQVFFLIIAGTTAKLLVVDFKVGYRSARLASPGISAQYLVA